MRCAIVFLLLIGLAYADCEIGEVVVEYDCISACNAGVDGEGNPVCVGSCASPTEFNPLCDHVFDWSAGDLESVFVVPDAIDRIWAHIDEIGNIGSLSDHMGELEEKIAEVNGINPDLFSLDACTGSTECSISGSSLSVGAISISLQDMHLDAGVSFEAVIEDDWQGFTFSMPAPPTTCAIDCYSEATFEDESGNTHSFYSDTAQDVFYGTSFTLPPDVTYTYSSGTDRFTIHGEVQIINRDCSSMADCSDSGVYINGDEVFVMGGPTGLDADIKYNAPEGSYQILIDDLAEDEYVRAGHTADNKYYVDLKGAGLSKVSVLTGQQGITYATDPAKDPAVLGEMWACNPIKGSCPHDEDSELEVVVTWGDLSTADTDDYFLLTMVSQDRLYADKTKGTSFDTCWCDDSPSCDVDCSCDTICQVDDMPIWLQVSFGYGDYQRNTNTDGHCTKGNCPRPYGSAYHIYKDGELLEQDDPDYIDFVRKNGGAQIFAPSGSLIEDNFNSIRAFPSSRQNCLGVDYSTSDTCPIACSSEGTCHSCLVKCRENDSVCNKTGSILDYLGTIITPEKPDNYAKSSTYIDFFCEHHCGYCNTRYPLFFIDRVDLSVGDSIEIDLVAGSVDEYPESVAYTIAGYDSSHVSCTIDTAEELCVHQSCIHDVCTENKHDKKRLKCTLDSPGADIVWLRAIDECGLQSIFGVYINQDVPDDVVVPDFPDFVPHPAEEPAQEPANEPAQDPIEEPVDEPADEPAEEPVDEPADEPAEEPDVEPAEEPVDEPAEEPVEEPGDEPADEPVDEPDAEPTDEPAQDPIEEPVDEPAEEPVDEPDSKKKTSYDDDIDSGSIDEIPVVYAAETIVSCENNLIDGTETGVDCGGSCEKKCWLGTRCDIHEDCVSSRCVGVCVVNRNIHDTDGDGIPDAEDACPNDPYAYQDIDGDGKCNPRDYDNDGDEIPDKWEEDNGLDKNNPADAHHTNEEGIEYIEVYKKERSYLWLLPVFLTVVLGAAAGGFYMYKKEKPEQKAKRPVMKAQLSKPVDFESMKKKKKLVDRKKKMQRKKLMDRFN